MHDQRRLPVGAAFFASAFFASAFFASAFFASAFFASALFTSALVTDGAIAKVVHLERASAPIALGLGQRRDVDAVERDKVVSPGSPG
ncbi:MAG: hypothetical protein CSA24_01305 [Deltaproteobacteria bacterium]|nr:MAG: hypothetical protein CSA24_01305 [Deltaproteobacteria bacterium]